MLGAIDLLRAQRMQITLDDVPEEVREAMQFHFAMTIDEVLGVTLEPGPVHQTA